MPAEVLNIRQVAASQQGYVLSEQIVKDGYLSKGYIHYPPGCIGLVYVRVSVAVDGSFKAVAPRSDTERGQPQYIALDNFTVPFPIELNVSKRDRMQVEIINYDIVNPHTITVLVFWHEGSRPGG